MATKTGRAGETGREGHGGVMGFGRLATGLAVLAFTLSACGEREIILEGERLDVTGAPVSETAAEVTQAAFRAPRTVTNADWTHRGGSPAHSYQSPALGAATTLVWSASVGEGDTRGHRITAEPVIAGGRVYTLDSRARVSAFTTAGAPVWSADLTPPGDREDDASGGGLAIAGNTLFVTLGFGRVVALDAASGAERWTQETEAAVTGAPTVLGGRVYVSARDGIGYALDTSTGRILWNVRARSSLTGFIGSLSPAATGQAVVFPFASGELVAAAPDTGGVLWTGYVLGPRTGRVFAGIGGVSSDPVISGNRVYAGTAAGQTVALEFGTGREIWRSGLGAVGPVTEAGGSVFFVTAGNDLVRLDASTGRTIWVEALPLFLNERSRRRKDVFAHFGPLLAGGRLILASDDGRLRSFDPESGALLGAVELPRGAATPPVAAGGTLYLVTEAGQLLAYR